MTVLSNTRQSLQLHLPKMTSVERARKRRRTTRRKAIAQGRRAEVPIPREAHRVSGTKGENHLPLAQLQFAWCALWCWSQLSTLRPVLIACRKASPPAYFTTSILPCQLHPIALFHLWTTLKSTKFPSSMIAIWIHAMPNTELTIQFASRRTIVLVKIRSKHGHTCSTDVAVSCLSGVAWKTLQVQLCMWQWYRLSPLHPFRPECPARTHAVPAA